VLRKVTLTSSPPRPPLGVTVPAVTLTVPAASLPETLAAAPEPAAVLGAAVTVDV
jgi:hypothetical protein